MRRNLNRTIAAALIGISFGAYVHYDYLKFSQLGREAYIAYETQRFDKYMAVPESAVVTILKFAIAFFLVFALYEWIAVWVSRILKSMAANGKDS